MSNLLLVVLVSAASLLTAAFAHTSTVSTTTTTLTKRERPNGVCLRAATSRSSTSSTASWVGRFCDECDEGRTHWSDVCWLSSHPRTPLLAHDEDDPESRWVVGWSTLESAQLDLQCIDPKLQERGGMNLYRLPVTTGRLSNEPRGDCPELYHCVGMIDGDLDPHVFCVRNQVVDNSWWIMHWRRPEAWGRTVHIALADVESAYYPPGQHPSQTGGGSWSRGDYGQAEMNLDVVLPQDVDHASFSARVAVDGGADIRPVHSVRVSRVASAGSQVEPICVSSDTGMSSSLCMTGHARDYHAGDTLRVQVRYAPMPAPMDARLSIGIADFDKVGIRARR